MKRRDVFALAGCAVVLPQATSAGGPEINRQRITTAPREPERTLLLFCPEQGGWHTGEWWEGNWVSSAEIELVLEPTHGPTFPTPLRSKNCPGRFA
jgi:hypothetical protein